jgi:hypothetical protein
MESVFQAPKEESEDGDKQKQHTQHLDAVAMDDLMHAPPPHRSLS